MKVSTRKRGKIWYYSFEASSINGKRNRIERAGGKTKAEAEKAGAIALSEYYQTGDLFEPSKISFADYLDYWIKSYCSKLSYSTQVGYKRNINNFIKPKLGHYPISSLKPRLIQEFVDYVYSLDYSYNQFKSILTPLQSALKYAVFPCEYLKENPCQYIVFPKAEDHKAKTNRKPLSISQIKKIYEIFPPNTDEHLIIQLALNLGLRIAEVCGLTWDDFNFDNNTVKIRKQITTEKNKWFLSSLKTTTSFETLNLNDNLVSLLKEQQSKQKANEKYYGKYYLRQYTIEEYDFSSYRSNEKYQIIETDVDSCFLTSPHTVSFVNTRESGKLIKPSNLKNISDKISNILGLDFSFHSFRHTYGTLLASSGLSPKALQHAMRHTKISTTMDIYVSFNEEMKDETKEKLEVINSKIANK